MKHRQIDNLFLYELLKNFGLSLIGIFIPVYIVSQGLSIFAGALFIAISGLTSIALSYPASKVISRIGFKHSLVLSYFFIIPGLMAIKYLELSVFTIAVSGCLFNLGRLFHNIGMNSEFAVDSDEEKRNDDAGKMLSLPSISRIIAPFLGGAVFASLGFTTLLAVSVLVLFLSCVPLLLSSEHRDPLEYDFRQLLEEEKFENIPLFIIRGIQAVTAVPIFGLFVFTIIGGSLDVGAARALDSLGFVLTGLLVGRYAGKINEKRFVLAGCIVAAIVSFSRGIITTPLEVFLVSFVGGISFQIYHVPIYSGFADEAEDTEILEFYTLRKIFVGLGNLLTVGALCLTLIFFDVRTAFSASFVLAGIANLFMAWIYLKNN